MSSAGNDPSSGPCGFRYHKAGKGIEWLTQHDETGDQRGTRGQEGEHKDTNVVQTAVTGLPGRVFVLQARI
ncbi:hypothetical protein DPMN_180546 [Dreissena polymorpha]|uniref:Uncharacterized protein n=1 Tax=Dreissena polymorpha TaxID=45954 RepID=A0A9D4EEW5_DREPO|nr:hypothetical protein DPMN_180546 [Dreissena polymorpha]